jgi:hypothetical protein
VVGLALGVTYKRDVRQTPHYAPVGVEVTPLERVRLGSLTYDPLYTVRTLLTVVGVDDLRVWLRQQLLLCVAEHLAVSSVNPQVAPV